MKKVENRIIQIPCKSGTIQNEIFLNGNSKYSIRNR
jgi:hypothetical protein